MPRRIEAMRPRTCLIITLTSLLLSLALVALCDQLVNTDSRQHVWALLPSSIVLVVTVGLLFLFYLTGQRKALAMTATVTLSLAGVIVLWPGPAQPPAALHLNIADFKQQQISTALTLLALGSGFLFTLFQNPPRSLSRAASVVLMTIGGVSLASVWAPTLTPYAYGVRPEANLLFSPIAILAGIALSGMKPMAERPDLAIPRHAWLAGAVCALIATLCWYGVRTYQVQDMIQRSEQLVQHVRGALLNKHQAELSLLNRMATRWQIVGQIPERALWYVEAKNYLRDFPELHLMVIVDGSRATDYVVRDKPESFLWLERFLSSDAGRGWLSHVHRYSGAQLSPIQFSPEGAPYSVLVSPISFSNDSDYAIAAVVNLRQLVIEILDNRETPFELMISIGERIIYDTQASIPVSPSRTVSLETASPSRDETWTVLTYTKMPGFPVGEFYLPASIFFTGGLMTFLFLLIIARGHHSREQSEAYGKLNQQLSDLLVREQGLRHTNERIMHFSPDILCSISADGCFLQINPATQSVLGYPPDTLIGQPLSRIVTPRDLSSTLENIGSAIEEGQIQDFRNRCLHSEGHEVAMDWSAEWSAEDSAFFCVGRDISATITAEVLAKEKQEFFSLTPEMFCIVDLNGLFFETNPAFSQVLGYPQSELVGTPYMRLVAEGDRERVARAVDLLTRGRSINNLEVRVRDHHANERWLQLNAIVSDDELIYCAARDITQLKRSHEEVQRLGTRLATVFESITDAFFTLDHDWRFTGVNTRSEELLQKPEKALMGQSIWEAFPEIRGTDFENQYRHAVETGTSVTFESYYEPLDNWIEVSAYPSDEGLAVYFRSIRERKEAEAKLQETLAELERSNQELESFAFVASHDLQEPLRKIQAFADRLVSRSDQLPDTEKDYLRRMQSAAARMQSLINDLLSYSRITTRAKRFDLCNTNALIDSVLGDLEAALQAEDATVEIDELPPIVGDESQLRQVLQNLISNGVKFHKKDTPPRVVIYAEGDTVQEGTLGQEWTLCIQDNGIGFSTDYAERIFEPFQRLHSRDEYAGTGIGLAIVKKVVERHGARISVQSAPGEGALFKITFPKYSDR
ncbi:PAS domain-containing protein [Marinobacter fonticola]|uniref:PAS domain-containing protein n=1 Tax=Marinobacter fonticola TaxID=2603215 RepID=UPI0011E78F9A|nr:PAS domain-containing protein [Marinobacter fonticola]